MTYDVCYSSKKKLNQNAKAACKKLLIQLPVQSALAVRTWSSWFLYDFMSLTSQWRNFLYGFAGIHLLIAVLRSRSGRLWLDHCSTKLLFFFSHFIVDLPLCSGSVSCSMTLFQPSFSCYLTPDYFGVARSSCWTHHPFTPFVFVQMLLCQPKPCSF